jgi:hypothetical protein
MPDPLSAAERYRSDAAKFLELAKDASSHFIRDYYTGLAKRYLKHAENQEEIARTSEGFGVTEIMLDSPGVQAAPESSPEEVAISDGPAPPTLLQPTQEPADAPERSRRRRSARGPRRPRKATSSKALREN